MASHARVERVAEMVQQEVSRMLVRGIKDPRIGLVTITGAKMSPDLREAWIYWAVHGDLKERQRTQEGLDAAKGYIRRELGTALSLRVLPHLHFVFDEAIERGDRIEQLIRKVHEDDGHRGGGEGGA